VFLFCIIKLYATTMGTITLTSDVPGNKVEIRKDLIIALESIEDMAPFGRNKTRVHLKEGKFKDVLEEISNVKQIVLTSS